MTAQHRQENYDWKDFRSQSDERYAAEDIEAIRSHNVMEGAPYEITFIKQVARNIFNTDLKGKALDAGCGAGWITKALADAGFQPTGMDLSEPGIALAKKQFSDINFLVGNGAKPQDYFDKPEFDLIVAREFHPFTRMNDYPFQKEIVDQYLGLLKPGGILVIGHGHPGHMRHVKTGEYFEELDMKKLSRDLNATGHFRALGPFHYHLYKKIKLAPHSTLDLALLHATTALISRMMGVELLRYLFIQKKN